MSAPPTMLLPLTLPLRPIDRKAFSPFGTLVEMGRPVVPVNAGTALRWDAHRLPRGDVPVRRDHVTSVYEAEASDLERPLSMLERHSNSAQLIMPLGGAGHVIVVCLDARDGDPDCGTLVAFRCTASQGVVYRPGVWHHPIMAIGTSARFLVQSWQDGSPADCEVTSIPPTAIVVADPS